MARIGVAVVGAGFMGGVHSEALRRAGCEVVGVLGVSDAESTKFASAIGAPKAYRSLKELLDDRAVESVHIGTPNKLHFEMAKAALEAGKHVLCEKPLAMTSAETAELVALARKHPKQAAAVNYNIRFYPLSLEARERVRGGALGKIHHVTGSYVQDWLLLETDYNWRVLAAEGGALRAVADIGTHWLDLVHAITGLEVEALCADLLTVHPVRRRPKGEVETFSGKLGQEADLEPVDITTEDYGAILMRFKGGARGTLVVSQVTAGRKNCLRYELAGEKGALAWNSENPEELWIGRRGGPNELLMRDPSILSGTARAAVGVPGGHAEGYADTFKQHFRAFYGYVAKGDFSAPPPFATFQDGHREVVLCEAVLESQRQGGWVTVKGVGGVKLGFVSAILPDLELEEVLAFANAEGFECVELMCWPKGKAERRYAGVTHLDAATLDERGADRVRRLLDEHGVTISGLGYYPNPLAPDPAEARVCIDHLKAVIRAAQLLGVGRANTFVGRDWTRTVDAQWPRFLETWRPLVAYAEQHEVRIGIENCPMLFTGDEWPGGKNLATSPAIWRRMFADIPSASFGLNFDPSHFVWQRMDYLKPLREFEERIFHVHAKDVRLDPERLDDVGILATPLEFHRPKLPGLGEVDWGQFFSVLSDTGYDGPVCVEVEDRAYEGSLDLRRQALRQSLGFLRNFA